MFKTGDKVVLKDGSDNTILHVSWSNPTHFTLQGGSEFYAVKSYTLVENMFKDEFSVGDKVIPSFKVGDRVKFKKSSLDSGMIDSDESCSYKVIAVDTKYQWVKIYQNGWPIMYHPNHFEHVKESVMTNTEEQEIKWEVGQEVWDVRYGKGVVTEVNNSSYSPISVAFENSDEEYTLGGKYYKDDKNRSLYFSEPQIIAEKFPPKKPFVPL